MLHILISVATLSTAIGSVATLQRQLANVTPYLLGGTILSGVALLLVSPGVSLVHLCVSGLTLTVVTIALHRVAVRRLATVG